MNATNKNITLLFESERSALYEVPEFTAEQRAQYFTLTEKELALALSRKGLSAQIHFILQLGYFKAVKAFYRVQWIDTDPEDCQFIREQYFPHQLLESCVVTKYEFYAQCRIISQLFEYTLWKNAYRSLLSMQVEKILSRDITPQYIMMELLAYLESQKIIRPGYTTLQSIISSIINAERKRLTDILQSNLSIEDKTLLETLLIDGSTLSNLAAIKQDAKDFKHYMIVAERHKLELLHPMYQLAKRIIPSLKLSQHNMHYYASLVNYYTIYDLRKRLKLEHSYLYLLCYVSKRYQQISDNLIAALCYHFKQIEEKVKTLAKNRFSNHIINQHEELLHMRRLAKLYIDDSLPDDVSLGFVRQKAFSILPRKTLIGTLSIAEKKHLQEVDFYWQAVDEVKHSVKTNLRHIVDSLTFSSTTQANSLLNAIHQVSSSRNSQKMKEDLDVAQENILPLKLRPHILTQEIGSPPQINSDRYEYWIYRRLNESIKTGAIYLEDSLRYKSLTHELVSLEEKEELIQDLDIPALKQPVTQQLDNLFAEFHNLWKKLDSNLRKGTLKHLRFDEKAKTLHIKKTRVHRDEKMENRFYEQIPFCDIVDVLRFVNKHTCFTSTFTHIQPRYAKQPIKEAALMATIIAQAMNNGNLNMAEISNIPYASLQDTLQSRIRLATLKAANDLISHGISKMSIYPLYSFDLEILYGGVDGQKFEVGSPTLKARRSKKYFGKGKGVVAYTLLANHIPLQTELIGANEHESYFLFDIWYNNTTDISPNIITGDMHSINRANFAIMHWFGAKLYPRFTNIEAQLKHLYVGSQQVSHKKYLIKPVGLIDRQLIENEWGNQQRIIATLGLKGMTQSMLIKKLCTYKQEHRLRKALFEFDKLIGSIHTLNYLLDPTIQRNTHRSQNRVESYHQLRAAIAQAYGKKQLTGKTDLALEISNQCGRLIANAIIYYNSAILSKLFDRYEEMDNKKALDLLKKISPVAWQHIHFQGHLIFSDQERINLDEITQQLNLG